MPVLKGLMARGFSKTVGGVMPSVTNVNNASIACGVWPEEHGITGNSFFDETKGDAEYMESATYLRCPTIFQRAAERGLNSALLTAKKKTAALLSRGTEVALAAEAPSAEEVRRYGQPPRSTAVRSTTGYGRSPSTCSKTAQSSTALRPHDRLPDAHMAPIGTRVQGAPCPARRPDRPGRGRRARRGFPHHGGPRPERQDPLLGPGKGLQEPRIGTPFGAFRRTRPLRQTPQDVRWNRLGLAEVTGDALAQPKSSDVSGELKPSSPGRKPPAVSTLCRNASGSWWSWATKRQSSAKLRKRLRLSPRRSARTVPFTKPRFHSSSTTNPATPPLPARFLNNFDLTRDLYRDPR